MPTYRVGSVQGREDYAGITPHALVCEQCRQEIGVEVPVARGQDKFSGMTAEGVIRVWPTLAVPVRAHDAKCQPPPPK